MELKRYFWTKKADHWDFYEGKFDLKGNFPVELKSILDSTKNISNASGKMIVPSN